MATWLCPPGTGGHSHARREKAVRRREPALWLALGLLALSSLVPRCARADTGWTALTSRDGLLRASVHALSPLSAGGMLIGTAGGLNVWDGTRLLSHTSAHGLAEGRITCAIEHAGQLWAGSWGGGLSVLDDSDGKGAAWRTFRAGDSPLPSNWISALTSDGESLWIATYGGGLARWRAGEWQIATRAHSPLPSDWLTALATDATGGLWISTQRMGLAHRDGEGAWRVYRPKTEWESEITALLATRGEVWAGTRDGAAILEPASGRWRWLGRADGLPGDEITALASADDGGVWVGTDQGLGLWRSGSIQTFDQREGLAHGTVSALSVDGQGRLWAGSYVRGLAVQGRLTLPAIERLPVVLVHGWKGPDSDQLEDSEFWHLARWLREDGFAPYYATGIRPEQTLHQNAARLGEFIAETCRETGAEKVYLIGFSMGGLNSRAYLESTLYDGKVERAFFLGSPHRGEHLWLPLLIWERLAWTEEPSALELVPLQMHLFNRAHASNGLVPYTLIAGDARQAGLPTLFRELPPGDGLVSTWSALGVDGPADRHVTNDIHAWSQETILLDLPTLLLPRSTYDGFIRPYLFGAWAAIGSAPASNAADYAAVALPPRTGFRTGTVEPGKSAVVELPVEAAGRARFDVRWRGPRLDLELTAPDGRQIAADDAVDDDRFEYLELGFADFASYVVTDTLPGPWRLTLTSDGDHREPSHYVAYATLDSGSALVVSTDREWYQAGDAVQIRANLEDLGQEGLVQTISCTVYRPDGLRETIRLKPGGGTGDTGVAYGGAYDLPPGQGYYVLDVRALGQRGEHLWERSQLIVIGVAARKAILRPPHRLQVGTMAQADRAQVGVSVYDAGDYLLSMALLDGEGQAVARIAHPVHLEPGDHQIAVPLSTAPRALASRGDLALGEILLLDISDAAILLDQGSGGVSRASTFTRHMETSR